MFDHAAEPALSSSESEGNHHEEPVDSASEVAAPAYKVVHASTVAQPLMPAEPLLLASQAPPALTEFERHRGQLRRTQLSGDFRWAVGVVSAFSRR